MYKSGLLLSAFPLVSHVEFNNDNVAFNTWVPGNSRALELRPDKVYIERLFDALRTVPDFSLTKPNILSVVKITNLRFLEICHNGKILRGVVPS